MKKPMKKICIGAACAFTVAAGIMPAFAQDETTYTKTTSTIVYEQPAVNVAIADSLKEYPELSNLRNAVQQATVLNDRFDAQKGYTLFAPINSAFNGFPAGDSAASDSLVLNHIVNDRVDITIMYGDKQVVQAMSGAKIEITKNDKDYYVNNRRIKEVHRSPQGLIYYVDDFITKK